MAMRIGTHEHHMLASLFADRDYSDEEASAIIGYAPSTVCNLRTQSAFKELVGFYRRKGASGEPPNQVDPGARMHALGLSTLEELQHRLVTDPEGWTKRELLEMAELLLIKARSLGERNTGPTPDNKLNLAISFVPAPKLAIEDKVIEGEAVTIPNGAERIAEGGDHG